ncbi:COG2847 Copper(I)-binding protein [Candidatus Nanopelagicaceae bacterium]
MKKKVIALCAAILALPLLSACGLGEDAAPAITISDPVVRSIDGMSMRNPETMKFMTGSFMTLSNSSDKDVTLIGGVSDAAGMIEIHEVNDGNMSALPEGLVIPAGGEVKLRMGGYHVMLMELSKELVAGDEVTVTLEFDNGEKVDYTAAVKDIAMDDETYGREGGM